MNNNAADMKIRNIAVVAVVTAALCVLAPVSLPIGPVPISLATFVIYLAVYVLGTSRALMSIFVYLVLGLSGIPVFSGYSAGPAKIMGPTGGYLVGYLPMAAVMGIIIAKAGMKTIPSILGMIAGTALLYFIGTARLMYSANMPLKAAMSAGVLPFIPLDLVKIGVASVVGPILVAALKRAGLLAPEGAA